MGDSYVGEVRLFGGNFAPYGWADCNGPLVSIDEYDALYNLLGTTYGGDGQTNFALPDLRARVPIHQGTGLGLSTYSMGQSGGAETQTLTTNQLPQHSHNVQAATVGQLASPANAVPAAARSDQAGVRIYSTTTASTTSFGAPIAPTGGDQPHENMQPYLGLRYIISLSGIYPSQQ